MNMKVLDDFSTFRAPGTKTYKFLVIFQVFLGPLGAKMVIFTKFHLF